MKKNKSYCILSCACSLLLLLFNCSDNKIAPTSVSQNESQNYTSQFMKQDVPQFEKVLKIAPQNKVKNERLDIPNLIESDIQEQLTAPQGFIWSVANWIWDITMPYGNPTLRYGAYSLSTDIYGYPSNINFIYVWAESYWRYLGQSKWLKLNEGDIGGFGYFARVEWITSKPDPWEAKQLSFHNFSYQMWQQNIWLEHPPVAAYECIDKITK